MTDVARERALLRARLGYALWALSAIVVGLVVYLYGNGLPPRLRDMMGDTLWGAMIAAWIGAAIPRAPLRLRTVAALALCSAVELSQLIHTPALDGVRQTSLGHLVLGSDFDWRDLAAYAGGVLGAALIEQRIRRRLVGLQRVMP